MNVLNLKNKAVGWLVTGIAYVVELFITGIYA